MNTDPVVKWLEDDLSAYTRVYGEPISGKILKIIELAKAQGRVSELAGQIYKWKGACVVPEEFFEALRDYERVRGEIK